MAILLKILKIIGKAFLWILAVLIVFIFVVLICPIKYEIKGEKYENLSIEAGVKLFLGLISVFVKYSSNGAEDIKIKVCGKELGKRKKKKKSTKKKSVDKEKLKPVLEEEPQLFVQEDSKADDAFENELDENQTKEWINKEADIANPKVKKIKMADVDKNLAQKKSTQQSVVKKIKNPDIENNDKGANKKEDSSGENSNEDSSKKREKIDVSYFLKMPKEERKLLVKSFFHLLKCLLRGVKPNNFYLKGTVGLSDPALTGEVVGLGWALNGMLNRRIELTAEFEREVIEGEVYIKGNIVPAYMMACIIRFLLVKPVRKIIKLLWKGSGDKNGK